MNNEQGKDRFSKDILDSPFTKTPITKNENELQTKTHQINLSAIGKA
jgi:hypothetical protein